MGFLENIFGDNFEIAYKEGVEQTSSVNNIYIDPDDFEDALASVGIDYEKLSNSNSFLDHYFDLSSSQSEQLKLSMGQVLEKSLERQQSGLTQALLDKYEAVEGTKTDIGTMALAIMSKGPLAIDNISLNGEIYGIAVLPSESLDSKSEVLDFLLSGSELSKFEIDEIKDNMPGSDNDWAKIIGFHEGTHLDGKDTGDGSVNSLQEESKADRRVVAEIKANIKETSDIFFDYDYDDSNKIDPDMLLALKDLRALVESSNDPEHATGPLLDSGDPASNLHIEVAKTYKKAMYDEVNENFDFESYEGKASDAKSLLRENPEIFFAVVNDGIKELHDNAMNEYNKSPSSFEARGLVVGAQILTDYVNDFEDAYRRRVLDQDIPEKIHSTQLIPQDVENEYYADLKHENALRDIEQVDRTKATYSSEEAFENFDWESYEGKANNPQDLYWENEGLYFVTIKNHLEDMKNTAIEKYEKSPSQENLMRMIEVEHIFDNNAEDINYSLKQILGENAPQLSTEHFVPEDKKREYYEARLAEKDAENTQNNDHETNTPSGNNDLSVKSEDREYEQGVDGTAYTAQVSLKEAGEPTVDFDKGVTVAGLPVGDFFAKNAAPSPEDVKLVNAISPETPDVAAISQTQENNLATQNLG